MIGKKCSIVGNPTFNQLTHEPLDEEREGDGVEDDDVENVLPVLLEVAHHTLPPSSTRRLTRT